VIDVITAEPTGVVDGMSDVPLTEIALSLVLQTK